MQPINLVAEPQRIQGKLAQVDSPVVLIEAALDPRELSQLRVELERRGFRATGGRYPAGYRNNDRLVFDDPDLAARLFAKLAAELPAEVHTAEGGRAQLVGLNPRFRACRYRDGQSFQRHRDGAYAPEEGVRSERTLMLYLTDGADHAGGRTRFYDSSDPDERARLCVTPRAGLATVFPHEAWHDGEPVTGGTKVVLRSDLLYRRCDDAASGREARGVGHRGYVWDLASLGSQSWLSVGRDSCVRRWVRAGAALRADGCWTLRLPSPTTVACKAGGSALVGSRHGEVASLRLGTGEAAHEGRPRRVSRSAVLNLAPCTQGYISTSADGVVRLLSDEGAVLARHALRRGGFLWGLAPLPGLGGPLESAGASDPRAVHDWLVGGERGRVHRLRFDGERFEEVSRTPLRAPLRSLAAHPRDGIWAGLRDGHIGELGGGGSTLAHAGPVTALAVLGDGRLVSGGEDGRVMLWSVAALRRAPSAPPQVLATQRDFITRLVPTTSGVLCAGYDGRVLSIDVGASGML